MTIDISETLASLAALQEEPLSIIRLSEPISAPQSSTRTSDASNSALDNPTPASLEADLSHYKVGSIFIVRVCYRADKSRNCFLNYVSPISSKSQKRSS